MLIVMKFGGSSVKDAECILNAAGRILSAKNNGDSVVVVLSAQGDTTDTLIGKAKELNKHPSKREMDMLISTGEQQSCALMAIALNSLGCPAISLNAYQAGIMTSSTYSNARIKNIFCDRINTELENKNVVVVTGFQGYNKFDDITTIGRGGSDTTAVAVAAALRADLCEIYTDVDGIYTADPRIVKNARKLDEVSYDEMLEFSALGAKVLHGPAVELAKKHRVKLVVRSSFTNDKGTVIKEESNMEKMLVSGVALDKNVSRISVLGVDDVPGTAFKIFSLLAKHQISVDIILQSVGRDNSKDISFTVARDDMETAVSALNDNKETLTIKSVLCDEKVAKVSVIGDGMVTNPGVASLMFEALYDAGINISMISTSEIKISVLISESSAEQAMISIHDRFILQNPR